MSALLSRLRGAVAEQMFGDLLSVNEQEDRDNEEFLDNLFFRFIDLVIAAESELMKQTQSSEDLSRLSVDSIKLVTFGATLLTTGDFDLDEKIISNIIQSLGFEGDEFCNKIDGRIVDMQEADDSHVSEIEWLAFSRDYFIMYLSGEIRFAMSKLLARKDIVERELQYSEWVRFYKHIGADLLLIASSRLHELTRDAIEAQVRAKEVRQKLGLGVHTNKVDLPPLIEIILDRAITDNQIIYLLNEILPGFEKQFSGESTHDNRADFLQLLRGSGTWGSKRTSSVRAGIDAKTSAKLKKDKDWAREKANDLIDSIPGRLDAKSKLKKK